jgi:CheY-like chemotaxis protein
VVVIEDDQDTAATLADILQLNGHTVHVAFNGPAGIEIVRQAQPDVVFCDIGMAGMDGYAVARALRSVVLFTGILVAFTGYVFSRDRDRCAAAGFDHHLSKPATVAQIIEIVRSSRPSASATM